MESSYWTGTFHAAMVTSDVFIVKAAALAVGTAAVKALTPAVARLGGAGLTNRQLVSKASVMAESAIGPVTETQRWRHMWYGSKKHRYAQKLLDEYQRVHGSQGLQLEKWFGKGRLDVFDSVNNIRL